MRYTIIPLITCSMLSVQSLLLVIHFHITDLGASMDIENQVFHRFNVRAVSGSNTLSIRNSGIITIDNDDNDNTGHHHNTDLEPYTQKLLSSQSIKIDSA